VAKVGSLAQVSKILIFRNRRAIIEESICIIVAKVGSLVVVPNILIFRNRWMPCGGIIAANIGRFAVIFDDSDFSETSSGRRRYHRGQSWESCAGINIFDFSKYQLGAVQRDNFGAFLVVLMDDE
jgi:hypothetical protein